MPTKPIISPNQRIAFLLAIQKSMEEGIYYWVSKPIKNALHAASFAGRHSESYDQLCVRAGLDLRIVQQLIRDEIITISNMRGKALLEEGKDGK